MGIHCLVCNRALGICRPNKLTCSAKCRKEKSRRPKPVNRVFGKRKLLTKGERNAILPKM